MKTYFRNLVKTLSGVALLFSPRVMFAALRLVTRRNRALVLGLPGLSFSARVKSSLTIPEPYSSPQAGFTRIVVLVIGAIVVLVGLIVVFSFVIPQVYISSGNMTTALTSAGAPTQAIQWWTWIFWGLVVLVVIGLGFAIVKGKKI